MAPHRGYSSWDRVTGTGRKVPVLDRTPGESKAQARCRARIDSFTSATDDGQTDAAALARDLGARLNYWRSQCSPHGDIEKLNSVAQVTPNRAVIRMGLFWLPFLGFVVIVAVVPALLGFNATMPVLLFFIMPVVMMTFVFCMRPAVRVTRTLAFSLCPDCEYSLKELPDAIELPGDERTGPAVCPECGCPWPLIPPRIPRI